MKNILKILPILAGLSFGIAEKVDGQCEIDSVKYCVYGNNKDSIIETTYFKSPNTKRTQQKNIYKNEKGNYKIVLLGKTQDSRILESENKLNKLEESIFNLRFSILSEEWNFPGEYVYDKEWNLVRRQIYK